MSAPQIVTAIAIGNSGVGKSENGNGYLQKLSFEANSDPDSCTFETSAQCNTIDGIKRYYIDTQGLSASDGLDAKHIQQMVKFLKEWKLGINAFFVVINIQCPRFDQNIQKLLKLIHDFFNNPNFWNQTGIVFTKCYENNFNKEIGEKKYRQLLIDFIKTLPGCSGLNPQIPCFFVDSVKWNTDETTKFEYIRMFEFAHKNPPVPTQKLQVVRPDYKSIEPIFNYRIFIRSVFEGYGPNTKRINYYEDQKILKYTDWDNKVTYSQPTTIKAYSEEFKTSVDEEIQKRIKVDSKIYGSGENEKLIEYYEDRKTIRYYDMRNNKNVENVEVLRSYSEEKKAQVKEETKVDKIEDKKEVFKTVKVGKCHWWKHRSKEQVHDYYIITTKYITYKRKVITSVYNKTSFGDWVIVDTRIERRNEY